MTNNHSAPPPTYVVFDRDLQIEGLTRTEIVQRVMDGAFTESSLIRTEGLSDWVPVCTAFSEIIKSKPQKSVSAGTTMCPACFLDRLWAYLLDSLILGVPLSILFSLGSLICIYVAADHSSIGGAMWLSLLVGTGSIWAAYPIYSLASSRQATFGMSLMGLRLITHNGERPSLKATSERTTISIFVSAFYLVGFIWAAFDSQNRTLHDLIAGTRVVKFTKTEAM